MNAKLTAIQKAVIEVSLVISIILVLGPTAAGEPAQYIVVTPTGVTTGDMVRISQ